MAKSQKTIEKLFKDWIVEKLDTDETEERPQYTRYTFYLSHRLHDDIKAVYTIYWPEFVALIHGDENIPLKHFTNEGKGINNLLAVLLDKYNGRLCFNGY